MLVGARSYKFVFLAVMTLSLMFPLQLLAQNEPVANTLRPEEQATPSQEDTPSVSDAPVGVSELKKRIENRAAQIAADTAMPAEQKEAIKQLHDQALLNITQVEQQQQDASKWAEKAKSAPDRLTQLQADLKGNGEGQGDSSSFEDLSFEALRQVSQKLQADLVSVDSKINELNREDKRREVRRAELPEAILTLKNALSDPVNVSPEASNSPQLDEARLWVNLTKQQVAESKLVVLENEQLAYEAESQLLPLQVKQAARDREQYAEQLKLLEKEAGKRRLGQIYTYQEQFQSNPLSSEYADVSRKMRRWLKIENEEEKAEDLDPASPSTDWISQVSDHALIRAEQDQIEALLKDWNDRKLRMESRIGTDKKDSMSKFNSWVGLMLRKQRGQLPSRDQQLIRLNALQAEIQKSDAWILEIEDVIARLSPGSKSQGSQDDAIEQPALSLAILQEMQSDVEAYNYDLYAVATTRQEMYQFVTDYQQFIDKHILWIRSSEAFSSRDVKSLFATFTWLGEPGKWSELGAALIHDSSRRFVWYVVGIAAIFLLLLNRGRILRRLAKFSQIAARKTCKDYLPTFRAVLLTIFLAIPFPLFLLFLGWRIEVSVQNWRLSTEALDLGNAISNGCYWAAAILFPLEVIRQLCRSEGVAEKHFEWEERNVATTRGNLLWLVLLVTPLSLIAWAFASQSTARFDAALGRSAFMLLMISLSAFFMRICRPTTGVFHRYISERQGGWTDRLRYVWYSALVIAPLVLAVLCFAGFHYTARKIAGHFLVTLWILLLLGIIYYSVKRWLLVGRRKLMMEQAKQRLELAAKSESSQAAALATQESMVDMVAINEQTKRLVSSTVVTLGLIGIYFVWQDVLPAVGVLDRFELWRVAGELPEETVAITLANLLLVIPVVILTVVATRNVPGLLEIALLQHLPITDAFRYAITTLARYAIVTLGIMIASTMIGLQWSSIQWLVAAMGVGLGFGLQEIVANFVSGIILLFEQPIRVGDIITVGGTTGTVSKIRIRATTVVNWDRQELIIPNKDLITGTLLNWTLTDSTNRVVLNIGVAYGTDTTRACEIIREVTAEHPEIMEDPSPNVTFEGFGDNTLNLVLRAYLATLDNRLGTINELHHQIYEALNQDGIELAFPQRDLHLKSVPESIARLLRPNSGTVAKPVKSSS